MWRRSSVIDMAIWIICEIILVSSNTPAVALTVRHLPIQPSPVLVVVGQRAQMSAIAWIQMLVPIDWWLK